MKIKESRITLLNVLGTLGRVPHPEGTVSFIADNGTATLARKGTGCELSMRLLEAAVLSQGSCAVDHQLLKNALERMDAVTVTVEQDRQQLVVTGDTGRAETLQAVTQPAKLLDIPQDADSTLLPTGFLGLLQQAFQAASSDTTRPICGGVNISSRGIAATDGHQLVHIPCPLLTLKGNVTLPQSQLYNQLRKLRWTSLSVWNHPSGETWSCIEGAGFRLAARALHGNYPNYWQVVPDDSELDISATIKSEDVRGRLIEFLKTVPDAQNAVVEMWFHNDRIEIADWSGRISNISANVAGANLPHGVRCRVEFLLRALKAGHTTFSHGSSGVSPIVASGAAGIYLWMPVAPPPASPPQYGKTNESTARPDATQIESNPNQQPAKEKQPMQTASAPFRPASSPISLPPSSPAPAAAPDVTPDPLQELTTLVASMKTQLDELQTSLLNASRKLRDAAQSARQKERVYQDTARKLERIRMAV